MLIIKYIKKGKEKLKCAKKNGKKVNAQMRKDENGIKCKR